MLPKTPGAVGCRHCQRLGATHVCSSCHRPVCSRCYLDLSSCPDPAPRVLQLGMGARLREVDATGRYGLVTTWRLARRIIDLGRGHQRRVPMLGGTGAEILSARGDDILPWPCPLPSGGLVASVKLSGFEGLYIWHGSPGDRGPGAIRPVVVHSHEQWTVIPKRLCLSEDGRLAAVARDDEVVEVVDIETARRLHTVTEPGHVVHAVTLSVGADLLALGAYGRVTFFRLSDGRRLGPMLISDGNLRWIGVGTGVVATITEHGRLEARRIIARAKPSRWLPLACPPELGAALRTPQEASLSRDGRLLATRDRQHRVVVLDLRSGVVHRLAEHTDRINLVRFVRGGAALVTADYDNRVVIWPRRGNELLRRGRGRARAQLAGRGEPASGPDAIELDPPPNTD